MKEFDMKGMKKYFGFIFPVLAGAVFLLYPSKAHAGLFDGLVEAVQGAIGWVSDQINNVINWILDFVFGLKCPSPADLLSKNLSDDGCWVCKIFAKIFQAINLLATSVYNNIHVSAISLLAVCLGIFILFRVGKAFMTFQPQDTMDFWNNMAKVLLKAVVASALLLQSASVIGYWIVSPFIEMAVSFNQVVLDSLVSDTQIYREVSEEQKQIVDEWAEQLLEKAKSTEGSGVEYLDYVAYSKAKGSNESFLTFTTCEYTAEDSGDGGEKDWWGQVVDDVSSSVTSATCDWFGWWCPAQEEEKEEVVEDTDTIFTPEIRQSLTCMIRGLYKEAAFALSVASFMICNAWRMERFAAIFPFPNFGVLIAGLAMWLTCFVMTVMFAFKIVDATVRLGIICALLPLLIVAWVFPPTVSYAKKALQITIQIMLTYVVTAIIMALGIMIIMNAFSMEDTDFNLREAFLGSESDAIKQIKDHISLFTGSFFIGLFCCVLAALIMKLVDKIASEYGGVDFGENTGDSVGAMAMKTMAVASQIGVRGVRLAGAKFGYGLLDRHRAHKDSRRDAKESKKSVASSTYSKAAAAATAAPAAAAAAAPKPTTTTSSSSSSSVSPAGSGAASDDTASRKAAGLAKSNADIATGMGKAKGYMTSDEAMFHYHGIGYNLSKQTEADFKAGNITEVERQQRLAVARAFTTANSEEDVVSNLNKIEAKGSNHWGGLDVSGTAQDVADNMATHKSFENASPEEQQNLRAVQFAADTKGLDQAGVNQKINENNVKQVYAAQVKAQRDAANAAKAEQQKATEESIAAGFQMFNDP